MSGWWPLILTFTVFLAAHVLPMRPGWRGPLIAALGRGGYLAAYGALSLVLLGLLVAAAGAAPFVPLWGPAPWQRLLVNLAMPAAVMLLVIGVGAPNPFGLGGQRAGFDPARPGLAGLTRHPLMTALAFWAGAHLIANGDLAHVLLFGTMLAFALAGLAAAEARARRRPNFAALAARTSLLPGAALLAGRWRPSGPPPAGRLLLALAAWAALLALHQPVIGASPLP